jgi:DNA-directed RNA polymerase specialized sigma24 family protein
VAISDDNAAWSLASGGLGCPPPYRSFASFVAALQQADRNALRAAYVWYMPLLRDQARKLGASPDERDEVAATVLGDVLLHLQETDVPPRDLVRYLVGALRNRVRNAHRERRRASDARARAYSDPGDGRQRIVAESHSEYGLRSSRGGPSGADDGPVPFRSAIQKLAAWSAQALTDLEATLMIGISHHVPLRELAEQVGMTHGAARVRVHRLRERFRKLVLQHVASLDEDERREMQRFFRRAGIILQEPAAKPAAARKPSGRDDAAGEGRDDTE